MNAGGCFQLLWLDTQMQVCCIILRCIAIDIFPFPGELWKLACFKKAQWLVQSNVTIPMWWASAYQVHTGPYWENRLMGVFHKRKTVNSKRKVV